MIESIRKNRKGILLMLMSSVCACVGQLLWKLSSQRGLAYLLIGFCFYAVGAVLMIVAYRFGRLSVLQPMLSLNYVLSIIFAAALLHERITALKCVGVIVIIVGVMLIAGGDEE